MDERNNGYENQSQNCKSPYFYLSTYRSELMGFAILWVVWFHSPLDLGFFSNRYLNYAFVFLKNIGYCGVDIFLLLSGMGIYNSLEKNKISQYIKNRFKRIIPVWWTYLILCILLGRFVFQVYYSPLEILGFATFTGFWLNMSNQGNWYVYAIMLFYLVSPVLHALIKNSSNKRRMTTVLVMTSLFISIAFVGSFKLIVFSRVPLYVIGMYISSSLKDYSLEKKHWIKVFVSFVFGIVLLFVFIRNLKDYLWTYGFWWYPFAVIAPTMSLLISKCFDFAHRFFNPLLFILSIMGNASLEILLVSDYIFANFEKLNYSLISEGITSLFVVVVSILIGILFHFFIEYIIKQGKHFSKTEKQRGTIC